MSYEQHIKHSHNHRKDRFYQQCSGYSHTFSNNSKTVSYDGCDELSKTSINRLLSDIKEYPIYIRQYSGGIWLTCNKNDCFGRMIKSKEHLMQLIQEYA